MGIFDKGVKKTNMNFFQKLGRAIVGKSKVDDDVLDALEEALLSSDMGVDTTLKVIENLEDRVEKDKYVSMDELVDLIRDEIGKLLNVNEDEAPVQPFDFSKKPYVMLVVGVNGVGKTTTIGKLASMLTAQGKKVVIGAADTFRAAAVEQLTIWAERAGVDIVKQAMGSETSSAAWSRTGRTRSCWCWTAPPARTPSSRRRNSPAPPMSPPSPSPNWTAAPRAAWSWASWTSSVSPSSSWESAKESTT